MTAISPQVSEAIEGDLRLRKYSLSKIARDYGIPMRDLIERFGSAATTSRVVADRPQIRPDLLKFVVSIKRSTSCWNINDELRRARELYDAGTHEMVQSTALGWSVLYLIPRQTPTAPRDYFRTMIHVEDLPE